MGEEKRGVIEAPSKAQARLKLIQQGILAKKISKKNHFLRRAHHRATDIILFTRHLATLTKAGIGLMQSVALFKNDQSNPVMLSLLSSIQADLESGLMLADALHRYPSAFNTLYCSMVYAGEQSGTLDKMLDKIATHEERRASLRRKIKKAFAYPLTIIVMALLITAGLMLFVIPQFEHLFTEFGSELPAFTQMVINLSTCIQTHGLLIFFACAVIVYTVMRAIPHSQALMHFKHQLILKLPFLGNIAKKIAIARFSRTLAITFGAGLPLTEALKTVANVTDNHLYISAILIIKNKVSNGHSLHKSMQETLHFPVLVTQMIAIGEESGALEKMLSKVADLYEEDIEHAIDALHSILEPLIMALLGLLVGSLVVAMYLPILKLGTVM